MARKYYTIAIRENGVWAPQFGDYDRMTVSFERDSYVDRGISGKDVKIITTAPGQKAIDAAIADLNNQEAFGAMMSAIK